MSSTSFRSLAASLGLLFPAVLAAQAPAPVPLDSGWQLSGDGTRIATHLGVPAITIRTGQAIRSDVRLEDGVIEFDMAVTRHRSFVYVTFRMQSRGELEEIYFRPHKSSLPDAIQYGPVWNGETNWQLYHGPGGTAAVELPPDRWIHVRLVMRGRRAALFVGDGAEPAMLMTLARDPAGGFLGFRSFVPEGGAPEGVTAAAFRNLTVRPGDGGYAIPPAPVPDRIPGLVTAWQLSPGFPADAEAMTAIPDSLLRGRETWRRYPVEADGRMVIGRHIPRPAPASGVIARLVLRSATAGWQRMDLGFSDFATVFVEGRPLFAGNAAYSFDLPRREGLLGLDQGTVWLPVKAGDTEVLIALTDSFGGRGLMARLDPAGPARLVAP